jgi:hypothetical protein
MGDDMTPVMPAVVLLPMPEPIRRLYAVVKELEALYPGRKFTPDGHLMGTLGEVIAEQAFSLKPLVPSNPGHDAEDQDGRLVQIKLTAGSGVSFYDTCQRLIVLRVTADREHVEVVYDGPGEPAWKAANVMQKNGQRTLSLSKLRKLAAPQL